MSYKCPVHDVPIRNATICQICVRGLKRDLGDITALEEDLNVTISRQAVIAREHGSKSSETALAFHVLASNALAHLRVTLVGWVRVMHDGSELWPDDPLSSVSAWLLCRVTAISQHEAAQTAVYDVNGAVIRARRSIDRADVRSRFFVAPCCEQVDGELCVGQIWATIPTDETDPAVMECHACNGRWDTSQWLRLGHKIRKQVA